MRKKPVMLFKSSYCIFTVFNEKKKDHTISTKYCSKLHIVHD